MAGTVSITGINSGLDYDTLINSIIEIERQNAYLLENEQVQKQAVISAFQSLQAKFLALSTELSKLKKTSTFEQSSVSVSDESVLTATTDGRVSSGSYDVRVLSLARNQQLASQGISSDSISAFGTGTISIQVGSGATRTVTIDSSNNSLLGIKNAINDAKIGVTASIINDGSDSNSYRMILTSDKPGAANRFTVTSDLAGGQGLDFNNSSFDSPEAVLMNSSSSSQISLGSTAAFTGSENKVYTFTVGGTGTQTIGSDNITLNWTDGTNSGAIIVTQADAEVLLVGDGSDGLTLNFSSGTLTAGDQFQVSTFSPLLQEASDARITLGSSGGSGSPIVVTSDTNSFDDLIGGLSLTVSRETEPGESVTVNTDLDTTGVRQQVESFISKYNAIIKYINEQNSYTEDSEDAGILFGDFTVWGLQNSLSSNISAVIDGIEGEYNQLRTIGIRTNGDGTLYLSDSSKLENALRNNLDDVISLFASAGDSSSSFIEFVSSTSKTKIGEALEVDITQVATHGRFQGGGITSPSTSGITLSNTNNRLRVKVDGLTSNELILAARTYTSGAELAREIQNQIDADSKIGNRGMTVEWIETGATTGYLNFESSTYGTGSKIEMITSQTNSAYTLLGLATGVSHEGLDVAGTINGEEAEGKGQFLEGVEGNATTEGLKIKVTLEAGQLVSGAEGTITITKGVAARMYDYVDSVTASGDGVIDRRIKAYQSQIDTLVEQVADIDERLEYRRQTLYQQFYAMEEALGLLNSESSYLTQQLDAINANWKALNKD
ncbi:MAG: flagellar filament capping protein FliD [Candidatus Zixiibacteriota bacterium]